MNERALVIVTERRLFLKQARAEVVALVNDVIRALAHLEQIGNKIFEHASGFFVAFVL